MAVLVRLWTPVTYALEAKAQAHEHAGNNWVTLMSTSHVAAMGTIERSKKPEKLTRGSKEGRIGPYRNMSSQIS